VSAARFPSTSVATAVARAEMPALSVRGPVTFQAWFEELAGPVYRLVASTVGPNGEALAINVSGEALIIAFASYDAASTTGGAVEPAKPE